MILVEGLSLVTGCVIAIEREAKGGTPSDLPKRRGASGPSVLYAERPTPDEFSARRSWCRYNTEGGWKKAGLARVLGAMGAPAELSPLSLPPYLMSSVRRSRNDRAEQTAAPDASLIRHAVPIVSRQQAGSLTRKLWAFTWGKRRK